MQKLRTRPKADVRAYCGEWLLPVQPVEIPRFILPLLSVGGIFRAGFIEVVSREQTTLYPELSDGWTGEYHLFRVVDLFVNQLDLATHGFRRHVAARTGRPG